MPNANRNKKNQPPTGEGKKQSPRSRAANKLHKRSTVLQAAGSRQNIGSRGRRSCSILWRRAIESEADESWSLTYIELAVL